MLRASKRALIELLYDLYREPGVNKDKIYDLIGLCANLDEKKAILEFTGWFDEDFGLKEGELR